jgi:hypothetical protein
MIGDEIVDIGRSHRSGIAEIGDLDEAPDMVARRAQPGVRCGASLFAPKRADSPRYRSSSEWPTPSLKRRAAMAGIAADRVKLTARARGTKKNQSVSYDESAT